MQTAGVPVTGRINAVPRLVVGQHEDSYISLEILLI